VYQREDEKGAVGVELNRDLVKVAGKALEKNLTRLGPLVLPISEQLCFAANFVQRKLLGKKHIKPYVPDFTRAFDHFCLHAGESGPCPKLFPAFRGIVGVLGLCTGFLAKSLFHPSFAGYVYGMRNLALC
jgi:hypothetical protein